MIRLKLASCTLVLAPAALALVGCGGEESLTGTPSTALEPSGEHISTTVDCDPHGVIAGAGGPRVSRTAAITVRHGEAPADLAVWVSGPEGKHAGESFARDDRTVFLPTQPYPAGAELAWHVRMCGEVHSGAFRTGSLLRPVPNGRFDDAIVGRSYALDLRVGRWSEPINEKGAPLIYALGGAILADVIARERGALQIAVSAAHPDNAGGYVRTGSSAVQVRELPWDDNPYAFLELEALALETSSGPVILREALIGFGFDTEGVAEAFVSASLEVSEHACLLLSDAGVSCEPCSADKGGTCVSLEVDHVYGVPL